MRNQSGQIILMLVLVMTVALAIGLSVIQRSLSDISTASKVEQSSRAYSAAEAGIEKAIQGDTSVSYTELGNSSVIQNVQRNTVPDTGQAFEYSLLAREELAHVWLANPGDLTTAYTGTTLGIYWGNENTTENPAIGITVIYQDSSGAYRDKKYFLDRNANTRNNNFDSSVTCPSSGISTSLTPAPQTKIFFCKRDIDVSSTALPGLSKLVLLRARLLYNDASQAFAVNPTSGSLPMQARLFTSTGESGGTQRKVRVFRLDKVVPPYFDYAIFSTGTISK